MTNIQKRFLLFLLGCIPTRLLFMYLAKTKLHLLPYLGYIALLIGIGFMYIYLTNSRTTGPEVFGDKIWWNHLRPIHSILYLLFAYYAINKKNYAWIFLAIDITIGLFAFLLFHYKSKHF
jgi:hypothetical protein